MKKIFYSIIIFSFFFSAFATSYPDNVRKVLQKAGENRPELEKVLRHYRADSLKYKAACFLIGNMDIHYSQTYQWEDSLGHIVPFNELDYPDYTTSIAAFDKLKAKTPKIHPVPVRYYDIDVITADYLINNIDNAFRVWRLNRGEKVSFKDFCEYILPYRISVEPLQSWRDKYNEKFAWLADSLKGKTAEAIYRFFEKMIGFQVENLYYKNVLKKEPLPLLGPLQMLHRKVGYCEDIAAFGVYMLRSQGYTAAVEPIPYWATSSGSHTLWTICNVLQESTAFDPLVKSSIRMPTIGREPSKVLQITYSKQPDVLANFEKEDNIPNSFLRLFNYKDVTSDYWPVKNLTIKLNQIANRQILYACVLNYQVWQPTWWARIKGDSAVFSNMTQGVVYLPAFYKEGKIIPAGYPVAMGYNNQTTLKPDIVHLRSVRITEQPRYLGFRPGKMYKLLYWDKQWKVVGAKMSDENTHELTFDNVPSNALLILIPDYSEQKERPFIITDEGVRVWF